MGRYRSVLVILLLAASVIFCFFGFKNFFLSRKPNVIFIVVDSLRADHLGCYGYGHNTTPTIDKLAGEGTLFSQAFSHGGYTYLSVPTLLTALYPHNHGMIAPSRKEKSDCTEFRGGITTFPEVFSKHGYATAAFGGPNFEKMPYLKRCFQSTNIVSTDDPDDLLTQNALAWLKKNRAKPFFLYLHYFDLHFPYNLVGQSVHGDENDIEIEKLVNDINKKGIFYFPTLTLLKDWFSTNDRDAGVLLDYLISRYDDEVRYVDNLVGVLLKGIEQLGLADNTLVVLTSDHGEEFNDHGSFLHSHKFYDELIHVPLILWMPKVIPEGRVVDGLVRHIDLMPTVCDILGICHKASINGISLMPFIRGRHSSELELYSSVSFADDSIFSWGSTIFRDWLLSRERELSPSERKMRPFELRDIGDMQEKVQNCIQEEPGKTAQRAGVLDGRLNLLEELNWHRSVLRSKKWALIERYNFSLRRQEFELYDMERDPAQSDDLSENMPELVRELKNKMASYAAE